MGDVIDVDFSEALYLDYCTDCGGSHFFVFRTQKDGSMAKQVCTNCLEVWNCETRDDLQGQGGDSGDVRQDPGDGGRSSA